MKQEAPQLSRREAERAERITQLQGFVPLLFEYLITNDIPEFRGPKMELQSDAINITSNFFKKIANDPRAKETLDKIHADMQDELNKKTLRNIPAGSTTTYGRVSFSTAEHAYLAPKVQEYTRAILSIIDDFSETSIRDTGETIVSNQNFTEEEKSDLVNMFTGIFFQARKNMREYID